MTSTKRAVTFNATPTIFEYEIDISDQPEQLCVCRRPSMGRFLVCCDSCEGWFHVDCVNLTPKEAETMDTYICHQCTNKNTQQKKDDAVKCIKVEAPPIKPSSVSTSCFISSSSSATVESEMTDIIDFAVNPASFNRKRKQTPFPTPPPHKRKKSVIVERE